MLLAALAWTEGEAAIAYVQIKNGMAERRTEEEKSVQTGLEEAQSEAMNEVQANEHGSGCARPVMIANGIATLR